MASILKALQTSWNILLKLLRGLSGVVGAGNLLGWTVAAAMPVAYAAIWLGVLTFGFSAITTWFIGSAPDIFGGSNFPSGAMWLLNQTFPLSLMFGSVVSLLVLKASASFLVTIAIQASRFLKS